jgi:hypothetical protein
MDVAKPPTGKLDLFNLYVFKSSHCRELMKDDDRFEILDRKTKEWWVKMGREQALNR